MKGVAVISRSGEGVSDSGELLASPFGSCDGFCSK